jgi:DNA repair photolyase
MRGDPRTVHGRGAASNPKNRFEKTWHERDPDEPWDPDEEPAPETQLIADSSRTIIATNDSPDIPFEASINPYRGCEHGCIYCYARPTHEYLGFSAGLEFETRILVKEDAPELLRRALMSPNWVPKPIAISGVTDPYQPIERRLNLTRGCLEVLAEFRNPVSVITKNRLVTRDIDFFQELARHDAVAVFLSVTTLDGELARSMEPRASTPAARLAAVRALAEAGVPAGVMVAPIIPGLTDHELPAILAAAADAGARCAGCLPVRLPLGVAPLFEDWLERIAPERKARVLGRIRGMRGGKLNDPRFGMRMRGTGPFAEMITQLHKSTCRRLGLNARPFALSTQSFRRPTGEQLRLFE